MATITLLEGTNASILTTELNTLTNNSLAISSAYSSGGGYVLAEIELAVTYGTSPTANTACSVWFLRAPDGTNYEDGGSSLTPARMPDCVLPLRAVNTAQRIVRRVPIPPGTFKVLLKNDGTGQSMSSSGNTLKLKPITHQF